jgi:hypothetical protein
MGGGGSSDRLPMRWPRLARTDPISFRWWWMEIEIGGAIVRVRAGVELGLLGKVVRLLKAMK